MRCTITLDGIPLGGVELAGAPRAIGRLQPAPAYTATGMRRRALRLGVALRLLAWRRVESPATARALAAALWHTARLQDRLGLIDEEARSIAIVHLLVAHFPRDPAPVVVAELREQAAPVAAEGRPPTSILGDASRPAA